MHKLSYSQPSTQAQHIPAADGTYLPAVMVNNVGPANQGNTETGEPITSMHSTKNEMDPKRISGNHKEVN